jgi:hypothetical protein
VQYFFSLTKKMEGDGMTGSNVIPELENERRSEEEV